MRRVLIVPAAGVGSRLGGEVPKALVAVGGRPMLARLLDLYAPFVSRAVVVVRPEAADRVRRLVEGGPVPVTLVTQAEPTGMLDAILLTRHDVAAEAPHRVWITWCDQVAVRRATLERLTRVEAVRPEPALVMPTSTGERPYIHFTRDGGGRIAGVLQRREGDPMPETGESDIGLFSLSAPTGLEALATFDAEAGRGAATGERNFLPFVPWLAQRAEVVTFPCTAPVEAIGINTPADLARVEGWLAAAGSEQVGPMSRVLSVVIPAYNEERFLATLIGRIRAVDLGRFDLSLQIIVVDDCSTDRTAEIARGCEGVTLVRHERNQGKGRAVRTGLERATGDFIIIQDADLEYDPRDWVPMLEALIDGPADGVYGSRYMAERPAGGAAGRSGGKRPGQGWAAYLGGRSLSVVARLLTGAWISDTVTALKLFRREVLSGMTLVTTGFELDHEITAKVLARGFRLVEVPIRYYPRSRAEGKKIGFRDWLTAVRTFWRFRNGG